MQIKFDDIIQILILMSVFFVSLVFLNVIDVGEYNRNFTIFIIGALLFGYSIILLSSKIEEIKNELKIHAN